MFVRVDKMQDGSLAIDASQEAETDEIIAVLERAVVSFRDGSDNKSNLVNHARRELEQIGEEPETIEGYLKVIQAFADMGHSGGSASVAIPVIHELLQFKNLGPITDNPDEWMHVGEAQWGEPGGVWHNIRNGEAFSHDGGKTYYLLSDGSNQREQKKWYTAEPHNA